MRSDARSRRPRLPSETIGILGTGLIGSSIGLRSRARGDRVLGWDRAPDSAAQALARGALDAVAADETALVAEADVIVLATPLAATLASLERLASRPPRASLIIDVASVKGPVHSAGARIEAFVATHPIAGSERSGPVAARADLFEGHAWTYDPDATPSATERARTFIAAMGSRPVPIPSALHDRIAALTSHLPQLLAVALAGRLAARLEQDGVLELLRNGHPVDDASRRFLVGDVGRYFERERSGGRAGSPGAFHRTLANRRRARSRA